MGQTVSINDEAVEAATAEAKRKGIKISEAVSELVVTGYSRRSAVRRHQKSSAKTKPAKAAKAAKPAKTSAKTKTKPKTAKKQPKPAAKAGRPSKPVEAAAEKATPASDDNWDE
jgi:hypothetical protein